MEKLAVAKLFLTVTGMTLYKHKGSNIEHKENRVKAYLS